MSVFQAERNELIGPAGTSAQKNGDGRHDQLARDQMEVVPVNLN